MYYGILKTSTNTGLASEIQCNFVAPISVRSNQPSYVQDSMNLKRNASSQYVQRWEISTDLSPENGTAFYLIHSVSNGHAQVFYVRMPQIANLETTSGNITLIGNSAAGTTSIATSGALTPGEFINIGSDPKVYLVLSAASNSAVISPQLRVAATSGSSLKLGGKVTMRARYDSDTQLGVTYVDGVLSNPGSVKLIEDLQ